MKAIHYSTKAKKDLKKYRNNIRLMEALYEVLSGLVKGEAVPEKYKPHELTGNYKGCMECHVGNDFFNMDRYKAGCDRGNQIRQSF